MEFIRNISFLIILFFVLKFLIYYTEKSIISLNKKIDLKPLNSGIVSINDIQKNNYENFISIVKSYLENKGFSDILLLPNGNSELTNFTAKLNDKEIYISCIQSDYLSEEPFIEGKSYILNTSSIEQFLGRLIFNNFTKGILITNNSFDTDCTKFINNLNSKNLSNIEINLIDGYELTNFIRNYNTFNKENLAYDNK